MPDIFDTLTQPSPTPTPSASSDLSSQSTGDIFDLIAGVKRPQATTGQKIANGPVHGLAGFASMLSALPGTLNKMVTRLTENDDLVSPASFVQAAKEVPTTPGRVMLPAETMMAPLRGNVLPKDPNYEPEKGIPRVLDTMGEYVGGTLPMAIMSGGTSILPSLATAATGGAGAGVIRNVMSKDNPARPWVELVTSVGTPMAARTGINVMKGAGIGPSIAGGADPVTGVAQPDHTLLGINTDSAAANKSFLQSLLPKFFGGKGEGIAAAREARGASLAEADAASKLQQTVVDKPAALQALDNSDKLATGSYLPTSGTASGDSGLLAIERGVAPQPKVFDRIQSNSAAISKNADTALAPSMGPGDAPETAQRIIGGKLASQTGAAKTAADTAESLQNTAKTELQQASDALSAPADAANRAESSRKVASGVTEGRNAAKVSKDALYDKVNPELPVKYDNTRAALTDATKHIGENESAHPLIEKMKLNRGGEGQAVADAGTYGTATVEGADTMKTPFWKIQSDLRAVNGALRDVTPGTPESMQLSKVKDGLLKDIEVAAKGDPALAEANAYNATEYAPAYKEGVSQKILSGKTDASLAIDEYMQKPQGARQLSMLVKKGDVNTADVRDWFVSKLASSGKPTPQNIQKFINKNGEVLSQFPDIKDELIATQKGLAQKTSKLSQLGEEVKAKQADLAAATENQTNSIQGKFSSQDHQAFMDSNLYSQGALSKLKPLIDEAKADPSGAAMEGLKNSIRESVRRKLTNVGRTVTTDNTAAAVENEDLPTSLAKAINITRKGSPTRQVMEQVFTPDEMSSLDQVGAQMRAEMRRSNRVTTGSSTTADSMAKDLVRSTPWTLSKMVPTRIASWMKDVFVDLSTKDKSAAYDRIIQNAVLDPKLAAALLRRPSPEAVAKLKKVIAPYITSGVEMKMNLDQQNGN